MLYVEGGDGKAYALSPVDGSVKWATALANNSGSSPTIGQDGTVYVGASASLYVADTIYGLNPGDGSVKWKANAGMAVYTSPAIGSDGTIYVGGQYVYAFAPDTGAIKWQSAIAAATNASPTVGADGTVYFGGADGSVYALNGADGSQKWKYRTGVDTYAEISGSPTLSLDGTLIIQGFDYPNGALYALNSADGTLKWALDNPGETESAAVDIDRTIYIGGGNFVRALSSQDETLRWQHDTHAEVVSSPAIAADGTVYAVCSMDGVDDGLYALGP